MKRVLFLSLIILTSTIVFSQDFDKLMTKKQIDCSEVSFNSGLYFIKYMKENKIDSAKSLLNYWETKCGMREPIYRANILLALNYGIFNDSLLIPGTLNNIFNYQDRMDMIKNLNYHSYDEYKSYYGFIPPGQEFDIYTHELATKLKKNYTPESIEYLLTEFYSDNSDTIFSKLQTKAYGKSVLTQEYEKEVESFVNRAEYHISLLSGVWIPTGELKKLGVHPELGLQTGLKHKKMNYDLVMSFKFINSPNEYYARATKANDSPELTNNFFGEHMGFDIGRDIYIKNGHELQLTGGIAIDGIEALPEDIDLDLDAETAWTYNINFGLGYRYYFTNEFYLGLRAKYNMVNYSLNNVVDFTGNPITIQFIVGGVTNQDKSDNLKALKYKIRK